MNDESVIVDGETAAVIKDLAVRYRTEPKLIMQRAVADLRAWCDQRESELVWKDSKGEQMFRAL